MNFIRFFALCVTMTLSFSSQAACYSSTVNGLIDDVNHAFDTYNELYYEYEDVCLWDAKSNVTYSYLCRDFSTRRSELSTMIYRFKRNKFDARTTKRRVIQAKNSCSNNGRAYRVLWDLESGLLKLEDHQVDLLKDFNGCKRDLDRKVKEFCN